MKWNVLLELELKCSLLLMVAFLVILLMRRFSSAQRYFVLMLAVCGGLLVPAAHLLLPHWETKILPPSSVEDQPAPQAAEAAPLVVPSEFVAAVNTPPTESLLERVESLVPVAEAQPIDEPETWVQETVAEPEEKPSISIDEIVAMVWLGGAALMMLSLLVGYLSAWRIVRRAPAVQGVWLETRERVRGRLAISREVALLECSSRLAPMAFGLFRPAIVLPVDGRA